MKYKYLGITADFPMVCIVCKQPINQGDNTLIDRRIKAQKKSLHEHCRPDDANTYYLRYNFTKER